MESWVSLGENWIRSHKYSDIGRAGIEPKILWSEGRDLTKYGRPHVYYEPIPIISYERRGDGKNWSIWHFETFIFWIQLNLFLLSVSNWIESVRHFDSRLGWATNDVILGQNLSENSHIRQRMEIILVSKQFRWILYITKRKGIWKCFLFQLGNDAIIFCFCEYS